MTDTQTAPGATGAASQQGAAAAAGTGTAAAPAGTGTNSNGQPGQAQQGQSQQQASAQASGQGQQQQGEKASGNNAGGKEQGQAQQGEGKGEPTKGDVTYTLKLPDGSLLPASDVEKIAAYAKERGLSNDAAQELLAQRHDAVKAYHESAMQKFTERSTQWVNDAKSDKTLAGEQGQEFEANTALAKRALNNFFGNELDAVLNETGYGNHPAVLRGFLKIAKAMGEDSLAQGNRGGGAGPKDAATVLYGGGKT